MLAPIMTKEMKLFPSQPLPSRIKNVRSRAQSLRDFYEPSTNATVGRGTANSLILLNEVNGSRTVRQRNSKSTTNLPINAKMQRNPLAESTSPRRQTEHEKSPQKTVSMKKPLDSIVEGMELQPSAAGTSQISSTNQHQPEMSRNLQKQPKSATSTQLEKANHDIKAKKKRTSTNEAKTTGCFTMWLRWKGKPKGGAELAASSTASLSTNEEYTRQK